MKSENSNRFWEHGEHGNEGCFVSGESLSNDLPYHEEVLLVFIHGFRGHYIETWRDLPLWMQEKAGLRCDSFSFWFAAQVHESADYVRATNELETKLRTDKFRKYRHIFFVVHSTGGIIAKELLKRERKKIEETPDSKLSTMNPDWLVLRTRQIINIAVPHSGGSLGSFMLTTISFPVLWIFWKVIGAFQFVRSALDGKRVQDGFPLGRNQIMLDLVFGSQKIIKLENEFRAFMTYLDNRILPRPVSTDYLGQEDKAIRMKYGENNKLTAYTTQTNETAIYEIHTLRGSHSMFKIPDNSNDLFVQLMAESIQNFASIPKTTLADRTIEISLRIDEGDHVEELISEVPNEEVVGFAEDERRTTDNSWLGSQKAVFDRLKQCFEDSSLSLDSTRPYILTGDAGVGKSVVVRRLFRYFAIESLKKGNCLPILMPLARIDYSIDLAKDDSFIDLLRWWCTWTNELNTDLINERGSGCIKNPFGIGWLRTCFPNENIIVVFDGFDDYLANAFGAKKYELLNAIESASSKINSLFSIIGVRSSIEMQGMTESDKVSEISRLSVPQARRIAKEQLGLKSLEIPDDTGRLFMLPIVFFRVVEQLEFGVSNRTTDVYETALRTMIGSSFMESVNPIFEKDFPDGRSRGCLDKDQWMDCISILGHIFYWSGCHSMTVDELGPIVRSVVDSWKKHSPPEHVKSECSEFVDNISLLNNLDILKALLRQTIFLWAGGWRIGHREDQEFLTARHLYHALRFENEIEFSRRGCPTKVYFYIGELLSLIHI